MDIAAANSVILIYLLLHYSHSHAGPFVLSPSGALLLKFILFLAPWGSRSLKQNTASCPGQQFDLSSQCERKAAAINHFWRRHRLYAHALELSVMYCGARTKQIMAMHHVQWSLFHFTNTCKPYLFCPFTWARALFLLWSRCVQRHSRTQICTINI